MNNFSRQNNSHEGSRVRILAVAAIVMIASAHLPAGLSSRAAVRLPEEAVSLEPWLLPSGGVPPAMDTPRVQELSPAQDGQRRTATAGSTRATADRGRRQNTGRKEKEALAEFMGLVGPSRAGQTFMQRFESLQNCREFVAVNC